MGKICITLKPGAKKNSISCDPDERIKVSVTSLPQKGNANSHLIKILAQALKVSQSSIQIKIGHKSRNKILEIKNLNTEEVIKTLKEKATEKVASTP